MTDSELRQMILTLLGNIAPEIDPAQIEPDVSFRDQLDIDSIDFQNLMIGINKRTNIEVPERDYPRLVTVNGAVAYLRARSPNN